MTLLIDQDNEEGGRVGWAGLDTARVTGATSFKEGYFFVAFSILPDTSFLLWT